MLTAGFEGAVPSPNTFPLGFCGADGQQSKAIDRIKKERDRNHTIFLRAEEERGRVEPRAMELSSVPRQELLGVVMMAAFTWMEPPGKSSRSFNDTSCPSPTSQQPVQGGCAILFINPLLRITAGVLSPFLQVHLTPKKLPTPSHWLKSSPSPNRCNFQSG